MKRDIREIIVPYACVESKICVKCGVSFPRTKNGRRAWEVRKYCSMGCYGRSKDNDLPDEKICAVCGAKYWRPEFGSATQWRNRICCSVECAAIMRSTHRMSETREYRIWTGMKNRCLNPNGPDYRLYGGRGIAVCNRWLNDFGAFFSDMGKCPDGMSIDRRENNSGYSPDNCRWATSRQQSNNRRSNVNVTSDGQTLSLTEWSEKLGVSVKSLQTRIIRGWGTVSVSGVSA